jgi:DNA polymerase-1
MNKPVYVIDGYSLIYRSYFAHIKNPLKNSKGENTSAVFGFVNSIDKLLADRRPEYLVVVMDSVTPTFRHHMFPEYKATRDAAPPDLHAQIPIIEKILDARGISCIRENGFEADDLIATIAVFLEKNGIPCIVFTKDKDILQLVGGNVSVLYPGQGQEYGEWKREEVFANKGIYPEQVTDFLALAGDASDNVPGVAGIGEKTAIKLLTEYGSLESIYSNLEKVPGALKEKLRKGKESAFLSHELVKLKCDVPITLDVDLYRIKETDILSVRKIYDSCDFKTLVKKLDTSDDVDIKQQAADEFTTTAPGTYVPVTTIAELDRWIDRAKRARVFAFDTETDGLDAVRARPIGFSLSFEEGSGCYIPIRAVGTSCPKEDDVRTRLKSLLEDPEMKIVGQNIKFDYMIMKHWGVTMKNPWFDTMIAAWVLDSTAGSFGMDALALKHLAHKTIHYKDLIPKNDGTILADLPLRTVTDYSGEDADITFRLYRVFEAELSKKENGKLKELFHTVEMPLVAVLADMELEGIYIETGYLVQYGKELDKRLLALENKIYGESSYTFNIRSTKELQTFLFEKLGLPQLKKTKTGSSTDAEVLRELALESTAAQDVLDHRILSKLKSTYADALPGQVNPDTGRLHTSYLQTGTATGRLSSISPNLQNIPVRDEEGKKIRSAFRAKDGSIFVSADYSQIELVVLAHLSGDARLREAFSNNKDVHAQTASIIYGVRESEVTSQMRRVGKTINFGVIYGMSAYRLSRDLKISRQDADSFIKAYFTEYSGVRKFNDETIEKASVNGYVETIRGRRRPIDKRIKSVNKAEKAQEERIAVNSPIQGSAADIVKLAMIEVVNRLSAAGLESKLLLQVHDELIFEVPEGEKEKAIRTITETMESIVPLDVPLRVGISTGKTWGELH